MIESLDDEEIEEVDEIQIIELPPENVDNISDEENLDEEELRPQNISFMPDTAGELEIHLHGHELNESTPTRHRKYQWEKGNDKPSCGLENTARDNTNDIQSLHDILGEMNPYEIFEFLSTGLAEKVSEETLLYSRQKNDEKFQCSKSDIQNFLGILYLSGHRQYPREENYWSTNENFECSLVRNTMSKNRYKSIKKYLHFNDNSCIPQNCTDRCYKIKPIYDICNSNFQQFGYFSNVYSVDEKIIEYYGRHPLKQFIRGKPIRFGLKEWAICNTNGYTFSASIYQGKHATDLEEKYREWNLGARVVLSLSHELPVQFLCSHDLFSS
ncbi:MAG: hypothetical protein AAGK05_16205 [Pseudomonadota bacterium]